MSQKIEDARAATNRAFIVHNKQLWAAFTGAQQASHLLDAVAAGVAPEIDDAREQIAAATASLIQANERLQALFRRMGWR